MKASRTLQTFLAIVGLFLIFCNYRLLAICTYTLALGIGFVFEEKSYKALVEGFCLTLMVIATAMSYAPLEKMTFQFLFLINYINWLAFGTASISVICRLIKRQEIKTARQGISDEESIEEKGKIINFIFKL